MEREHLLEVIEDLRKDKDWWKNQCNYLKQELELLKQEIAQLKQELFIKADQSGK